MQLYYSAVRFRFDSTKQALSKRGTLNKQQCKQQHKQHYKQHSKQQTQIYFNTYFPFSLQKSFKTVADLLFITKCNWSSIETFK